ncbi:translocation protein TolB [Gimesia panareensis]|uniref:Translocation protein TolB n=1 Tax=Gimesia panareensis TaxID=2527978 RepID=A0A518FXN2_9PLAN|nr:PD40 domain-containing protein [Gimesia panareensis]QDV21139.1 translocation protein TolB [Gimesia panareensis]
MNVQHLSVTALLAACLLISSGNPACYADEKPKVNRTRFYITNLEGKDPKVFFFAEDYYNTGSPAFSPDGQKLAFDGWKSQAGESFSNVRLMVVNADGSDFKVIGPGAMPSWSPGGNRLAFSKPPYSVAVINVDGTNEKIIAESGWGAQWSPDGTRISYTSGNNIRVYNLIEDTTTNLFPPGESPYSRFYWNSTWSPDSNWICILGRRADDSTYDVLTVNTAGSKAGYKVHFNSKRSPYQDMAWSPQGDMIVFGSPTSPRQLLHFNPAEDKPPTPLDITIDGNINGDLSFAPDGQRLLFNARDK